MRSKVMRRAWEAYRAGYSTEFAECLRDAWAEHRDEFVMVLETRVETPTEAMYRTWCSQPLLAS